MNEEATKKMNKTENDASQLEEKLRCKYTLNILQLLNIVINDKYGMAGTKYVIINVAELNR